MYEKKGAYPVDTGRKLNVHNVLYVLWTSYVRSI